MEAITVRMPFPCRLCNILMISAERGSVLGVKSDEGRCHINISTSLPIPGVSCVIHAFLYSHKTLRSRVLTFALYGSWSFVNQCPKIGCIQSIQASAELVSVRYESSWDAV